MLIANNNGHDAKSVYHAGNKVTYGPLSSITLKEDVVAHEIVDKVVQIRADIELLEARSANNPSAMLQGLIGINVKVELLLRKLIREEILFQSELDSALETT